MDGLNGSQISTGLVGQRPEPAEGVKKRKESWSTPRPKRTKIDSSTSVVPTHSYEDIRWAARVLVQLRYGKLRTSRPPASAVIDLTKGANPQPKIVLAPTRVSLIAVPASLLYRLPQSRPLLPRFRDDTIVALFRLVPESQKLVVSDYFKNGAGQSNVTHFLFVYGQGGTGLEGRFVTACRRLFDLTKHSWFWGNRLPMGEQGRPRRFYMAAPFPFRLRLYRTDLNPGQAVATAEIRFTGNNDDVVAVDGNGFVRFASSVAEVMTWVSEKLDFGGR